MADSDSRPSKRPRVSYIPRPDGFDTPKKQPSKPTSTAALNLDFKSAFNPTPANDASPKKPRAVRVLKPPQLVFNPPAPKKQKQTVKQPLNIQLPTSPPPVPQSTRRAPPAQPTASSSKLPPAPLLNTKPKSLRPPPPIPISLVPPMPQLKALRPPKLKGLGEQSPPPLRGLRTISTTHIARAMDLTSDTGAASLLSITLQGRDLGSWIAFGDGDEDGVGGAGDEEGEGREVRRGVGVSPVKPGARGKTQGFVRNGLAERASNLLSRSQTAYTLWHKEISALSQASASSTTTLRVNADLHLVIIRVLHATSPTHTSPHKRKPKSKSKPATGPTPGPAIALCRVLRAPRAPSPPAFRFPSSPSPSPEREVCDVHKGEVYPVLFSSSPSLSPPGIQIKEGREVGVWKPWYGVALPQGPGETGIEVKGDVEGREEDVFWGGLELGMNGGMDVAVEKEVKMEDGVGERQVERMGKRVKRRYGKVLVCPRFFVLEA